MSIALARSIFSLSPGEIQFQRRGPACCPDSTTVEQPLLFSVVLGKSNNVCGDGGTGDSEIDNE